MPAGPSPSTTIPLLAKLIGYGPDRRQAIARLARALPEYFVAGIKTNLGLFRRILADGDFQSGKIDTGYLERLLQVKSDSSGDDARKRTANIAAIAAAVFTWLDSASKTGGNGTAPGGGANGPASSSWKKAARSEGLM